MRTYYMAFIFVMALAAPAAAQNAAPAVVKTFTSSAEVQQLIAKAKADRKEGQTTVIEPILSLASHHANLEYRPIAGPALVHDVENEIVYVIDGAGTMTLGGQLVNPTRPNPTNQSAAAISGGTETVLGKGDFLMVPHGTPHQVTAVKGGPLVLMTMHMPQ